MAKLMTCGTCNHQVSSTATQCPNCGQKFKKKTSPIVWIIAAFFGLPFLWGIFSASTSNNTPSLNEQTKQITTTSTSEPITQQDSVKWQYDEDTDKMRGTKSYFAYLNSSNSANFQFPYNGESHLKIIVRNTGEGNEVMFAIDKGQFHCGIDGCELSIKFDNEPVKTYHANEAEAGKTDVIFLASSKDAFIKKLKSSKKVIIEAPFFNEPKTQFDFETSGLEWKH